MTDELAVRTTSTTLSIAGDQDTFTPVQLAALESMGIDDAPAGQIDLFFHQAKRTGLDPFSKQIYMIGRRTNKKKWNPETRQKEDNWITEYTIQTGIDGYRVLGHRTADQRGDTLEIPEPMWRGTDTGWADVWLGGPGKPPAAAKVTIVVNGQKYTATAMYSEYVQTYESGGNQIPNSMWRKMPANQLAKCAEAAAWRLAYPADFAGMVLEDAVQVIDEGGNVVERAPRVRVESRRGGAGLRERLAAKREAEAVGPAAEAEPSKPAAEPEPIADPAQRERLEAIVADALGKAGYATDEQRGAYLADTLGRSLTSWADVTDGELGDVLAVLQAADAAAAQ